MAGHSRKLDAISARIDAIWILSEAAAYCTRWCGLKGQGIVQVFEQRPNMFDQGHGIPADFSTCSQGVRRSLPLSGHCTSS